MTEAEIQNAILVKYGRELDLTLWRQNTGQLRQEWVTEAHIKRLLGILRESSGKRDALAIGRLQDAMKLCSSLLAMPARYVRYGLCVGSSDLIGIVSMRGVEGGLTLGIMLAAEVKRPGKHPTKEQQMFIDLINSRGGVAGCVHSVEEFGELLEKARER